MGISSSLGSMVVFPPAMTFVVLARMARKTMTRRMMAMIRMVMITFPIFAVVCAFGASVARGTSVVVVAVGVGVVAIRTYFGCFPVPKRVPASSTKSILASPLPTRASFSAWSYLSLPLEALTIAFATLMVASIFC